MMKRRMSALRIKDEKNNKKADLAMKKLKYHEFIQDLEKGERQNKAIYKQKVQNKIQEQRFLNSA